MEYADIHNRSVRFEHSLAKVRDSLAISPENREKILKFDSFESAVGKKFGTRQKSLIILHNFARWFDKKDFKEVSREDMQAVFSDQVANMKTKDGRPLGIATVMDYRKVVKKFYRWLLGDNEEYPKVVSWIKIKTLKCKVTPSDVITEDELKRMIDRMDHPRDKAFISTLFNCQARIEEFLNLRVGDVRFERNGGFLSIPQHKGQEEVTYRSVFIDFCVPYLANWLQAHPCREDKSAFIWVNWGARNHGKLMTYSACSKLLREAGSRAKVLKPLNPHNMRHSGNTYLAGLGVNPQTLSTRNGHSSLKMAMVYTHLGAGQDRDAILRAKGVVTEERPTTLLIKKCAKCKSDNPPTANRCDNCGWDLGLGENQLVNQLQGTVAEQNERIKNMEKLIQSIVEGRVVVRT